MMETLVLRFRDLNIPDGETIRRHSAAIEDHGQCWWGWISRQRETFPLSVFQDYSNHAKSPNGVEVFLYHSGFGILYPATLSRLAAQAKGQKIRTPELEYTPDYMSEAMCSAWFCLSQIGEPIEQPNLQIKDFPTLVEVKPPDTMFVDEPVEDLANLRISTATMWVAEVNY